MKQPNGTLPRLAAETIACLVLAACLAGMVVLTFQMAVARTPISIFAIDAPMLSQRGLYAPERTADGTHTYRWSDGDATITLPVGGHPAVLEILLAGGPERTVAAEVTVGGSTQQVVVQPDLRSYQLLVPAVLSNTTEISLRSPQFEDPGSTRRLGLAVGEIAFRPYHQFDLAAMLVQMTLGVALYLALRWLRLGMLLAWVLALLAQAIGPLAYGAFDLQLSPALLVALPVAVGVVVGAAQLAQTASAAPQPLAWAAWRWQGLAAEDWAGLGAILLATVVYYWPYLVLGRSIIPYDLLSILAPWQAPGTPIRNSMLGDVLRQYVPWHTLYAQALRSGELPFWNPYTFSGMSFYANLQSMVLYPPNLAFLLPSLDMAYTVFLFGHTLASGIGMYWLARQFERSPLAAFCAAVVWMFCGFVAIWRPWLSIAATLTWVPWLLCAIRWQFCGGGWRAAGLLGMAIGLLLLAGHIQFAYYSLFLAGAFVLWHLVVQLLNWPMRGWHALRCAVGFVLGGCIAAVQLLPTFELSRFGSRGTLPIRELMGGAIPVSHLPSLLFPLLRGDAIHYSGPGNFIEFTGYIGITTLLLFGTLVAARGLGWRSGLWFFAACALVGLHLAYGGALNLVLGKLPLYTSFRGLQRLYSLWSLGAAVCVAWAVDALLQPARGRGWRGAWAAFCLFAALLLGFGQVFGLDTLARRWQFPLYNGFTDVAWVAMLLAGLGVCVALLLLPWRWPRVAGMLLLPLVLGLDLAGFSSTTYPVLPAPEGFPETPGLVFLREHNAEGRMLRVGPGILESPLPPNLPMMWGVEEIDGYDSFTLDRYSQLIELAEPERYTNVRAFNVLGNFERPASLGSPILAMLGARFALAVRPLPEAALPVGWQQVYSGPDMTIYQNDRALPLAFVPNRVEAQADPQAQLATLGAADFDPARLAVLETEQPFDQAASGSARITGRSLNTLSLDVAMHTSAGQNGLLVIRQNFYPGWQAWVDGAPAPLLRGNFNLQALALPAGQHSVELRFTPTGFWPLLALMLASVLACLACLIWPRRLPVAR